MAVPDFQTLMLPILELLADRRQWTTSDLRAAVARRLALSEEEVEERIPSGRTTRFANNVRWAAHYMKRAGLLESPQRGVYRLTEEGRALLQTEPGRVDVATLRRYEGFDQFYGATDSSSRAAVSDAPREDAGQESLDPDAAIQRSYALHRARVRDELLERVLGQAPEFFERVVVGLVTNLGYGVTDDSLHLGRSGDGGVDGVIWEGPLRLDPVYVQAKRYHPGHGVGRPEVQAFVGSLEGHRARKGVFMTTSSFSRDATDYVQRIDKQVALIDGERLADMMYQTGLGVSIVETFELKEVDSDFFDADPD